MELRGQGIPRIPLRMNACSDVFRFGPAMLLAFTFALHAGDSEAERVEASSPLQAPDHWQFPERPTRIHVARGLWWDQYRLHEAIALAGGARLAWSHDVLGSTSYHGHGQTLRDFPHSYPELLSFNTIVIAGIRADAFPQTTRVRLQRWTERGGGLLVLGGLLTFGHGGYHQTAIEDALPVLSAASGDRRHALQGLVLEPTSAGLEFLGRLPPWGQKPRVYYYYIATPKPESTVLIQVGGHPLLVLGKVGQGRSAAFLGSVCGVPAAGDMPFWEWDGWPLVVSRVLQHLSDTPPPDRNPTTSLEDSPEHLQALHELAEGPADLDEMEEESDASAQKRSDTAEKLARFQSLLPFCRSTPYALAIVKAAASGAFPLDLPTSERTFQAIEPYLAGEKFIDPAQDLIASESPGTAVLALRILGRLHARAAHPVAIRFLTQGLAALQKPDSATGGQPPSGLDEQLRLAAVRAILDYPGPVLLGPVREAAPVLTKLCAAGEGDDAETLALRRSLFQEFLAARSILGDREALVSFFHSLLAQEAEIRETLSTLERPVFAGDKASLHARQHAQVSLPALRARQARLFTFLARIPLDLTPELIRNEALWTDALASIPLQTFLAARDARPPSSESVKPLLALVERGPSIELRALAAERIRASSDAALVDLLGQLLEQLAATEQPLAARFALSQLPLVPESGRTAILRAALRSPVADVALQAIHGICLVPAADQPALEATVRNRSGR
ncbi:MAG: hypothetical protein HYU36_04155 [Planctomycetes bacterium]|nr:hypothetical protein [Planctomycetota bacterium]